jgi:hypothetical protein
MNRIHPKLFNTVSELKIAHDEQFIRLAYQVILDKKVDSDGLSHYLQCIADEVSRVDILASVINSSESIFLKINMLHSKSSQIQAKSVLAEPIRVDDECAFEIMDQLSKLLLSSSEALILKNNHE